jgi:hypothetical protein
MASAIFDTDAFVKRLTGAGMPERQAAPLIGDQLATKADLRELEQRLKDQLTIRLGSMIAVAIAIVAALVKLL